jgi:hypothetical protein
VPERAIAVDPREFEDEGLRGLLHRALGRNPVDAIGIFVLVIAAGAILVNGLYRQPGPHPAPIFSIKPRPVASEPAGGVVPAMPRARPEALASAKPEAAAHAPVKTDASAHTPPKTEMASPRPRPDPIAELIAPAPRVTAVQRALNDYGYGPVKVTGNFGAETVSAIQKFERDRKLPVTGQISTRLLRELAALTGRPLE